MKFIFVDSFDIKWNGKTARYNSGISGSHTAHMYLAEGLAKYNTNEVILVSTVNNIIEDTYNGVKYINMVNFNTTACDYIIIMNNLQSLVILDFITKYNKILIVTQNDLFNIPSLFFNIKKEKVLICYISEFAKTNISIVQPFLKEYDSILLYNSVDVNDLLHIPINKDKPDNYICYFACIDRGYKMALEIVNKLGTYKLLTNNYDNDNYYKDNIGNVIVTENTSKYEIFKNISKSKYFIYPLINLDNNQIHYDTFAYVVLESLLLGVVVIVPKIQVFVELYGDAVCYIDTDDLIPEQYLLYWKQRNPNFGYPILDRYVEKVKWLDNNPEIRKEYIEKGLNFYNNYSNSKISAELMVQLDETNLIKTHLQTQSNLRCIPSNHINYLQKLKMDGFEPKVIYDIGSCVLQWTIEARKIWPNAKIILFDAFSEAHFLYKDYEHHIGVLSNKDDKVVKFYQSMIHPGGNSYYREVGCEVSNVYFPENNYVEKITKRLDTIVRERSFPLPDLVKIDVQGAEVDIIQGGLNTLKHTTRMIVELQHTEYNKGALLNIYSLPLIESILPMECVDPLFQNNGPAGDYGFLKI
jgi:FkbM family methyltransferase